MRINEKEYRIEPGANLRSANLRSAGLWGANLQGAKNIPALVVAQTIITPEGSLIGWKKCMNGVIVCLHIPANARRTNSTGRKCRAEFVEVISVEGASVGISQHDQKTAYKVGESVHCDKWEENRWTECGGGIHFFLTREEAEAY